MRDSTLAEFAKDFLVYPDEVVQAQCDLLRTSRQNLRRYIHLHRPLGEEQPLLDV